MWPFTKEEILEDTTDAIIAGQRIYQLNCDPELLEKSITQISDIFRVWVTSELQLAQNTNQDLSTHLIFQLRYFDTKFAAHDTYKVGLDMILEDTSVNQSGSRFMDTILFIYITIPQEVLDTITGRFLAGVVYYLPRTINNTAVPDKEQWVDILKKHSWLPLLPIFQQVFDTDETIKKIVELINKSNAKNVQIATSVRTNAVAS